MEVEIVRADKAYRLKLFLAYLLLIIVGYLAIRFLLPAGLLAFRNLEVHSYFNVAEIASIVFLIAFVAPALYLIRIGRKIVLHKMAPFPGMKVIRDTAILRGEKAIARGRQLIILGYISISAAVVGSGLIHLVFIKIKATPIINAMPLF
jgi:hypothetical protein